MDIKPIFNSNPNIDQTEYYYFDKGFTDEELDWINNLTELYDFDEASVVGSTTGDDISKIRKSKVKWLPYNEKTQWLYEKLSNFAIEANNEIWGFNIHSVIDNIQYTEYHEREKKSKMGDHYDWHVDIGPSSINHRKISIVVQLSDPDDYVGGDLILWNGRQSYINKKKGAVAVFPSFILHKVSPIQKGLRKSLVLWLSGDPYQ